jgi:STE24 endopeptidase
LKQLQLLVLFYLFIPPRSTLAIQPTSADSSTPASTALPVSSATELVSLPVSPENRMLEYRPPPAEYARAKAYSNARYRHFFVNNLYGFLVLLALLRWRTAPWLRNLAERVSSRRSVQLLIFAPAILLIIGVLNLPSDIWDHWLERGFGLSAQTWTSWSSDWITNQVVTLIVGTVLVGILYAVIRHSPRRWWFYFWLASIPLFLAAFFLKPLVVDPLFYTFRPLAGAQPALVHEIQKVTLRGRIEIPADRMFIMNASSKTTEMDAYVTGFGASKRVVVWDTMIRKASMPETLFVFGHEMGHYVLLHIPKEIACDEAIVLVLLLLGYRLTLSMLARRKTEWGIRDLGDWASVPMLFLLITLLAFLATPAFNAVSRHFEHEADRYGLEVIHGIVPNANQVAVDYFEKSGEVNLSDPDPNWFIKTWFYDHPTRPERVHFSATYNPWAQGEEPKYVK